MSSNMKMASMKWFQEGRFGMFVHWGLYAITGRDMWYYSHEAVAQDTYEQLFRKFNPIDYNPEEWARLAKKAGMKYAVFVTKHHDGFCLWDSEYTDFKITKTLYGRDVLRMWIDAYRAEGLKVGVYYSLLDWHHPHFIVDYLHPQRAHAAELNKNRDFPKYVEYLHNQVRELMTNYGRIDIFWPDFSYGPNSEMGFEGKHAPHWQSHELKAMVEELQPGILVNNRLGLRGEIKSDFTTPEQYIPEEDISRKETDASMWEACETIGASWGYHRSDNDMKSTARLISELVTCVSNNGNLLLNVGPTPRGRIQPEFVEKLTQIGEWMNLYGDSIYGAGKAICSPIIGGCPLRHYVYTQKSNNLYLHFFDRYPTYNLILPDLGGGKVDYIEFVGDKTEVAFDEIVIDGHANLRLHLPIIYPNPYDTVIQIVLKVEK